ncbi:MAG: PAS domain-containing protein [Deltaproteobacteria bacterium]|nr:PAS domain-containing protein [Deltaproteobacteria bacterium]
MGLKKSKAKESKGTIDSKAAEVSVTAEKELSGFPIVGIGASAGGLAAFEAFFSAMPADTESGMAFVLVQHLAPDHKSILSDLIKRYTQMRVFEVEDGMKAEPNCAYIIPPNRDMAFLNGTLQLLEPSAPRGMRLPIDFFFRSLALDQRERAICIVLSGTGSDGTLGVRAIKGEGGMVMAQVPESTMYDGMPRSAIATGLVDYVLPPAEMPAHLIAYVARAFGKTPLPAYPATLLFESALKKVFVLLRAQTSHDFSQYKQNTIIRRVERRMAVHQIERVDGYVRYLQQTPIEVEALFRDLLIGVTNFFRDPEAFEALQKQVIQRLFSGKPAGALVRVWVPGCSTGEEAYSIAILIQEHLEELKQSYRVQVFATDVDNKAIDQARAGVYPVSIAADISPERLARFFTQESDGCAYRIHKGIRDMLVFSEQDVIKDPPFSKLDLISCRNLLIYMGGELQKKIIPLFHYALNPGGWLFLGTSETVGDFVDLFATLDRKSKVYQRKEDLQGAYHPTGKFLSPLLQEEAMPRVYKKVSAQGKLQLREMTEQGLLQKYSPVGVLITERGHILYIHGRSGRYLEPAPGEAGLNILKMAREGLRRELTTALHRAAAINESVYHPGLLVKTNGGFTAVNLTIQPVAVAPSADIQPDLFLVILEEAPAADQERLKTHTDLNTTEGATDVDAHIVALKQELRAKEEYLQTTNEELETSNEELKSSNEELQSVNEELQSTNEELETSKEELQSINEELNTVNAELQQKVTDLSRANNDMNNLLAGTGIGTIFVDYQLRILRFTPAVTQMINLILTDVGRPVGHIVSNLVGYDRMVEDVQAVLDTLVPRELEVQTRAGAWFVIRIMPYRTLENVIEGAVITFVNITEMRKAREAVRESEATFRQLIESLPQLVWTCRDDGSCDYPSPQWVEYTGMPGSTQVGLGWLNQLHPEDRDPASNAWNTVVASGGIFEVKVRIRRQDGIYRWFKTQAIPLRDAAGRVSKWFVTHTDIDDQKRIEEALRLNEERLQAALQASSNMVFNQDQALRYTWITNPHPAFAREPVLGRTDADLLPADEAAHLTALKQRVLETGVGTRDQIRTNIDGQEFYYDLFVEPLRDKAGVVTGIMSAMLNLESRGSRDRIDETAEATQLKPSGCAS